MTKTYYHATPFENLDSIMEKGILKDRYGYVYLTTKPDEAARFVAIHMCRDILVVEVDLEEDLVEESFDHSQTFFKCRAYRYQGDVSPDDIREIHRYQL